MMPTYLSKPLTNIAAGLHCRFAVYAEYDGEPGYTVVQEDIAADGDAENATPVHTFAAESDARRLADLSAGADGAYPAEWCDWAEASIRDAAIDLIGAAFGGGAPWAVFVVRDGRVTGVRGAE
jgi:hypothetical protein